MSKFIACGRFVSFVAILLGCMVPASAANISWDNASGGDWTTPGNWSGDQTFYTNGDNVTFGEDFASAINIPSAVAPGSTTVNHATGVYTFSGSPISGPLNKSGSGVLTLSSANSFSGITLAGGEVRYDATNRLGGGAISVTDNSTLTVLGQIGGPNNAIGVASGKTLTFNATSGNYAQYTGVISGDGGLAFTGSGNPTYVQNANNTFAGDITIAGPAIFTNNGAFGAAGKTIHLNGGWFQWVGSASADRTLVIASRQR